MKTVFEKYKFHPLIKASQKWKVLDLTKGPIYLKKGEYAIGKYAEKRIGQYTDESFYGRDIHMGMDLIAPVGTKLYSPFKMKFIDRAYLSRQQDYGYCLLSKLIWPERDLYLFWGHLSRKSFAEIRFDKFYEAGESFAEIGSEYENGNWHPHLHFQLSWYRPMQCDLPGVVSEKDFADAKLRYPNPSHILGELYV